MEHDLELMHKFRNEVFLGPSYVQPELVAAAAQAPCTGRALFTDHHMQLIGRGLSQELSLQSCSPKSLALLPDFR
jgi:hypothetical protein